MVNISIDLLLVLTVKLLKFAKNTFLWTGVYPQKLTFISSTHDELQNIFDNDFEDLYTCTTDS